MSMQIGQRPQLLPQRREAARVCALVLTAAGKVLLSRGKSGGWSLSRWELPEWEVYAAETLQRELPALGIVPLSVRLLSTLEGCELYVVDAFAEVGEGRTNKELRFFALDALPSGLEARDIRALELLRVCWGVE